MARLLISLFFLLSTALYAELKVEVHGYAKLDIEFNDTNTGGAPSPAPLQVPLNAQKADQHGELIVDAREYRFNIKGTDQYNTLKMTAFGEADFFTVSSNALVNNGWNLRLRHAYMLGELHTGLSLLAGQTWTLFMNTNIGQPNLIDFNGPVGTIFARQPQLRLSYKKQFGDDTSQHFLFDVDIEKQSFPTLGCVNENTLVDTAQGSGQLLPLTVGKISYFQKYFQIEIGGAASKSYVEPDMACISGKELHRFVWAAESSAQITYKKLILYGSFRHLSGLNRLDGGNFTYDLVLNTRGRLIPIHSNGWYAGGAWVFRPNKLSINTVFGWEKASKVPNSPFTGSQYGEYWSYHLNLLYLFWIRWQTGLEYVHFSVKNFNGQHGHVDEIRTCLFYYF